MSENYKEMSLEQLSGELHALRQVQFKLRMQRATEQLAKPQQVRKIRRNIARVKTYMSQLKASISASNEVSTS